MPKGNLFDHAAAIGSGAPLDYKVKVQHRSDILMEEQVHRSHLNKRHVLIAFCYFFVCVY